MKRLLKFVLEKKSKSRYILIILISFMHLLLSTPFSYFNNSFHQEEIKAFWQPPDIVFMIVWPILYLLFGLQNLYVFNTSKLKQNIKVDIIYKSIIEAVGQTLWLVLYTNVIFSENSFFFEKGFSYYTGGIIIVILAIYAWFVRLPSIWKYDKKLSLLLFPYLFWISFASILNIQIIYRYIFKV